MLAVWEAYFAVIRGREMDVDVDVDVDMDVK